MVSQITVQLGDAIARAIEDGEDCARDVILNDGWRKAPGQSLVIADLIRDRPSKERIKIMTAWNTAYHRTCIALTDFTDMGA